MGPISQATRTGRIETRIGALVSVTAVAVLTVWNAASLLGDNTFKYALYALPALIWLVFVVVLRGRVAVEKRPLLALLIYCLVALTSMIIVGRADWFSARDVLIIGSYIAVFALFFRAPRFVADALLAFCLIATVSVLAIRGVSSDMDMARPSGQLLESVISFPAGLLLLYFLSERQWARSLITLVLFVLAFKRIAFVGVGAVLCLELCLLLFLRRPLGRFATTVGVVAISVVALFSLQVFDMLTMLLDQPGASANSVSLGRAEIAAELWRQIQGGGVSDALMGFGPGAADRHVFMAGLDLNPHNDWLKILFEYGIVGFVGLHAVLWLLIPDTPLGNRFYLYTAILMTTDNPLIYTFYFVFLFLIVRIAADRSAVPPPVRTAVGTGGRHLKTATGATGQAGAIGA